MARKRTIKTAKESPALTEARALWSQYEKQGARAITVDVEALYFRVFGEPLKPCNCKDRIGDALILIINHLKHNNPIMSERNYILKRGVVVHWEGETYTRVNITDEVASAWAERFPEADVWEQKPEPVAVKEVEPINEEASK